MINNNLSFIKTVKSFKYSVNVKFDMGDYDKVNNYIPTANSVNLFKDIFDSFRDNPLSRAHLLTGAYGTGKSLFATILGTMLSERENKDKFLTFLNKISKYNEILAEKMRGKIYDESPYLIILPSTEHNSFKQSMLTALQKALVREGIEDIFPTTYYKSVIEKLKQWKEEYPETYLKFERIVKGETGETINKFINKINNFNRESYDLFVDSYTKLTSGGTYSPFYGCDLNNIYLEVTREVIKKGYRGIYVIFDEFNKLLEDNIENFNGKSLQDFAEMSTRSDSNEIHLLLITHKNLLQYTTALPKKQIDEWKKIEGRFKKLDATQYSSQIYELIESVIIKPDKQWKNYKEANRIRFEKITEQLNKFNIFPSYNKIERDDTIVKGCYPLHPLVSYLLPKLSQKIAQNERTIFTFLSTDEKYTLGEYINNENTHEFPLINLDRVYDYFEDLMRQELEYANVHQAWSDSQRALQNVNSYEKEILIKSLAVICAVNNFSDVPPSREILRFALIDLSDQEFEDIINELIEDKIILYRKSINQFLFFEGSEIDFNKLINEKISERSQTFYGNYLLDNYFKPGPIYPKAYNDEFKIRRYFANEYMYLNELKNIDNWDDYLARYNNKSYVDGLIIYLLLESKEEIEQATEITLQNNTPRVIYVIPDKTIDIRSYLKRLDALLILKDDKKLMEQDALASKEVEAYIEETKQIINNILDKFIKPHLNNCIYINNGKERKDINSRRILSNFVSKICFNEFRKTPIINNELIVKNKITSPQKSARRELVSKLLFSELKAGLEISGYGPDYLIYRTLFIKTNLFIEEDNKILKVNPTFRSDTENSSKEVNKNLKNVIDIIIDELYNSPNTLSFDEVYDKLRRPPYGLRKGIIPLLITIAGRINNDIKQVIIRHNGQQREINAQLFEEINRYPARFTIEREEWSDLKEDYVEYLESLYSSTLSEKEYNEINRLNKLFYAIKKWYQSLPKYSRETTTDISETSLALRNILNSRSTEVKKLLFNGVCKKTLGKEGFKNNKDLNKIKKIFKEFRIEHMEAHHNLIITLQEKLISIFAEGKMKFTDSLIHWYSSLEEKAKSYTYSRRECNSLLKILSQLNNTQINGSDLIDKLAMSFTGFKTGEWNDKTAEEFLLQITEVRNEIMGFQLDNDYNDEDNYEFVLVDNTGRTYKRIFKEIQLEGIAETLEKKIRGSMKNIGSFVNEQEKQQILINILRDIIDEEGIA